MTTTPQAGDPVETVRAVIDSNGINGQMTWSTSGPPVSPRPVATQAAVTPTQMRRPWRSTVRTFVQALVPTILTLGLVVPEIVKVVLEESGDSLPDHFRVALLGISAATAAAAAIVARVMAIPAVEVLLRRFKLTSWLAAAPAPPA